VVLWLVLWAVATENYCTKIVLTVKRKLSCESESVKLYVQFYTEQSDLLM